MRVRFVKSHRGHQAGEVVELLYSEAWQLVKTGVAIVDKSMTAGDGRTK